MRNETKHTPGPWTVEAYGEGRRMIAAPKPYETWVATIDGINPEANARLIAAAPDLLEACKGELTADGCVRGCPRKLSSDNAHNARCVAVRAAIAKAEGSK